MKSTAIKEGKDKIDKTNELFMNEKDCISIEKAMKEAKKRWKNK